MSNGNGLELLEQNREALLLAEVAALLHNLGKLSSAFLAYQRYKACKNNILYEINPEDKKFEKFNFQAIVGLLIQDVSTSSGKEPEWYKEYENQWNNNNNLNIFLPQDFRELLKIRNIKLPAPLDDRSYGIGDFIEYQSYKYYKNDNSRINVIFPDGSMATELLEISHNAASGAEKEGRTNDGKQPKKPTYLATVFGYEYPIDEDEIDNSRNQFIKKFTLIYNELWKIVKEAFIFGVGDTQRTINDITLWDISSSTASFFKSAIARLVIDRQWVNRDNFDWRILTLSFDGLGFLERAPTIGDMLGRYESVQEALNAVKTLLEETYPLGNEVYRDENRSAFVVPALDGDDDRGSKLRGLVENHILSSWRQSELGCELKPEIFVSQPHKQAAKLHEALQKPLPPIEPFPEDIQRWWQGEANDICTVCGVRPQGPGQKAKNRHVCDVCERRREDRSKEWAQARNPETSDKTPWQRTIWIDEVADKNGRLALIVGKFDLMEWLNGNLIQTLLVTANPPKPKNPSFARIQRVWRTTQKFWEEMEKTRIPEILPKFHRVEIKVLNKDELTEKLGNYHAYDAEINSRRITLVWDSGSKSLLTSVNLFAWIDGGAKEFCKNLTNDTEIQLFESVGYGQSREQRTTAIVKEAEVIDIPYTPIIPLLAEPSSFMMLVPASKALKVAEKISQRYELEMSKVRNRLPLLLGAVFFDQRLPFFSALDAGRRMLDIDLREEEFRITCSCMKSQKNGDRPPEHLQHNHFKEWHELRLTDNKNESLQWFASTVKGDGEIETPDDWYPYVHVVKDEHDQTPTGRKQFLHPRKSSQQWVHVSEVQIGDTIKYAPSRFTWLHLDTSARRFEALDNDRIHPLEELERITRLWGSLKSLANGNRLTESKLQAVVSLLAAKRKAWKDSPEQFEQLAETTLKKEKLKVVSLEDVTSGRLERMFEIHHHILKEKVNDKNSEGERS